MPAPLSPQLCPSPNSKERQSYAPAPVDLHSMSLSTSSPSTAADHLMTARTRHQHELDAINQQLALFVHQYTQHIHHSLQALAPLTQRPSTSPAQPSLDDILPPPPKPKRKPINHHSYQHTPTNHTTTTTTTTTASITPAAVDTTVNSDSDQQYRDEEDEVERDAYGVLIKRRRSKLPLRSVLELRSWFAEHLQAPYPTDSQRDELAQRAQLTVKQVQNWFTNTRKRFWAPWVKRQQATGHGAASVEGSHDTLLHGTADAMVHITFDGFSLQGS